MAINTNKPKESTLDPYKKISNQAVNAKAEQYKAMLQAQKYSDNTLKSQGIQNSGVGANQRMGAYSNYMNNLGQIDMNRANQVYNQQQQDLATEKEKQLRLYETYANAMQDNTLYGNQQVIDRAKQGGLSEEYLSQLSSAQDLNVSKYNEEKTNTELANKLNTAQTNEEKAKILEEYKNIIGQDIYDLFDSNIKTGTETEEALNFGVDINEAKYSEVSKDVSKTPSNWADDGYEIGHKIGKDYVDLAKGTIKTIDGNLIQLKNGDIVDFHVGGNLRSNYVYYNGELYKTSDKLKDNYRFKTKSTGKNTSSYGFIAGNRK